MHQQLIPERDSGPKPKPRPRTARANTTKPPEVSRRTQKHGNENDVDDVISLSSVNSASTGFDNYAYSHDEQETSFRPSKPPTKYHSSDSEPENNNVVRNQVFSVDVHNFNSQQKSSSDKSEAEENLPTKLQAPPKPKPRSKSPLTDSDASTTDSKATTETHHHQDDRKPQPRSRKNSPSSPPQRDYVTIPMPPEKEDASVEKNNNTLKQGKFEPKGFVNKWKSAAQNLITKVPISKDSSSSAGKGNKMKGTPETRIEIQNLDFSSSENIEMTSFRKHGSPSSSTMVHDTVETVNETKPPRRTKALLKREDEDDIKRLKEAVNPSTTQGIASPQLSTPSKRQRRRAEKSEKHEKYFGVTIHSCDVLPIDPNIVHPVVKVTILNDDGTVILKSSKSEKSLGSADRQKGSKQDKKKNRDKDKGSEEKSSSKRNDTERKMKENSPSSSFTANSILPIMTQPCKLGSYLPTFAPAWNELLVFEESFSRIVHSDSTAVLFFEVMDFLPASGATHFGSRLFKEYHGSEDGWYKIAWGFLKLIGANGARNINRKLRLQLYKPQYLSPKMKSEGIEVYHWWKLDRRRKIDSTLYVTVKAVPTKVPTAQTASLQTLLTMKKEDLTQAILDSQLTSPKKTKDKDSAVEVDRKPGQTDVRLPQWRRLEGQICKIPNKMLKSLPSSPIESLNLTICGNVQCVKFSPCGLKLAAGLDTDELHTIVIFEMPKGKLLSSIRCHHGIIYDLDWRILDGDEPTFVPKSYYLASASADMTATVWEIYGSSNTPPKLVKKLLHPAFVYCVKIHPTKRSLVFTGCFDYAIRIWDVQKASPSRSNRLSPDTESVPLVLLDQHGSFVNCLTFDSMGQHMYSGDGSGCVFEWTSASPGRKKSWKVTREMNFRESGKNPINSVQVHPHGNRLLVHVRNSAIRIVDLESLLTLHTLTGLVNEKLQVQSCFSPCGNLVLSGSEDSTLCIWDADTGTVLQFVNPENHRHCVVTSVDYHPHDYYVVIGLASTISEPNPIILYTHKQAKPAKMQLKTLSKLALLNKSSSFSMDSIPDENAIIPEPTAKSFGMGRGDSSEKFIMIVKKLDAALQVARKSRTGIPPDDGSSALAKFSGTTATDGADKVDQVSLEGSGEGPATVLVTSRKESIPVKPEPMKHKRKDDSEDEPTKERPSANGTRSQQPESPMKFQGKNQKNDVRISSFDAEDSWDSPRKTVQSALHNISIMEEQLDMPEKLRDESSDTGSSRVSRQRQKRRERRRMFDE